MKSAALVLLIVVGMVFTVLGQEPLTPDKIIKALMGSSPPFWKVCFALDSSGSISDKDWDYSKSASRDILAIIDNTPGPRSIAPTKHRIGLVRFSSTIPTRVVFSLGTYPLFKNNDIAIGDVLKVGYLTDTYKGLLLCENELGVNGSRLVWVTTDGLHTVGGNAVEKAEAMQKKGIIICVVAVGSHAQMKVINRMASLIDIPGSNTKQRCVLNYKTFEALRSDTLSALHRVLS
ncbi:uncharacterized protein LOC106168030 [Lingula anatina]|uniref:Uncharacterized protein LOC106168030 n=1 Tax=Lingula anatina TaxID=7574 RepID=A0A1S3IWR6_LINAN|nr:uncharacterized protein LOC106168030 [Lingula anatina]|eukprot:XP_013402411.1 uncharacterized protein LOC106168030 [Lingula anatina]